MAVSRSFVVHEKILEKLKELKNELGANIYRVDWSDYCNCCLYCYWDSKTVVFKIGEFVERKIVPIVECKIILNEVKMSREDWDGI